MASNSTNNTGIGVIGLLGVAFVVLKLTGYIDWSWWLVTLPFWWWIVPLLIVGFGALLIDLGIQLKRIAKK